MNNYKNWMGRNTLAHANHYKIPSPNLFTWIVYKVSHFRNM